MAVDFADVNWLAVLVATIVQAALGAGWFGAFAKPWAAAAIPGKTREEIQAGPKWPYAVAVGGALVTAYVTAVLLSALGATSLGATLGVALLLGLGIVAVAFAISYSFAWRPPVLIAIDGGYHLVRLVVVALVIGLWP